MRRPRRILRDIPKLDTIGPDTPLRLNVAAALAYPDGSMTDSGLRRERDRGRLVVERVAGKDYTTLGHINRMRELCRLEAKARASTCDRRDTTTRDTTRQSGSSATKAAIKAQAVLHTILKEPNALSPPISRTSTRERPEKAAVIPVKSRLPMS
jgi:hypothetical protein